MMTLTRYGLKEWGLATFGAVATIACCIAIHIIMPRFPVFILWILIAWAMLFWLCIAGFFRSPKRKLPADKTLILSPADGTVKDIEEVEFTEAPFNGKALRVGIFLSVFNVHVNRAPAEWSVSSKVYREGEFLDARNPKCISENEAMTLIGEGKIDDIKFPMAVRQISGAIAKRIVCPVNPGHKLNRGEIYGMIKFGSRTELYLPCNGEFTLQVKIGDKVNGGTSVLAKLNK